MLGTPMTAADITDAVQRRFDSCPDARLRTVLQSLVRHLHAFAVEVGLTEDEWRQGIDALTATGQITDERRQEFILWSDAMGVSMLVDVWQNGENRLYAVQDPDVPEHHLRGRFQSREGRSLRIPRRAAGALHDPA